MFDDFEYTPEGDVWDRISAETAEGTDRGALAAMFADCAWAPNRRVWRGVMAGLYPMRRRRAVIWWSAAAGIALLLGMSLYFTLRPDPNQIQGVIVENRPETPANPKSPEHNKSNSLQPETPQDPSSPQNIVQDEDGAAGNQMRRDGRPGLGPQQFSHTPNTPNQRRNPSNPGDPSNPADQNTGDSLPKTPFVPFAPSPKDLIVEQNPSDPSKQTPDSMLHDQ
ncbi:MAG: hypothetical protein AAF570_28395, partial [Bacteroidota bacterium]